MKSRLFVLLTAVLMAVCATNVYAQAKDGDNNAKQGQVTLNIKLSQIQTLMVNTSQKTVDLNYSTEDHYKDGATSKQEDHLTVFSTGAFEVKASTTDLMNSENNSIESSDIKLIASVGSSNKMVGEKFTTIDKLTNEGNHVLITSSKGGRDLKYDVTYSAAGEDAYINKYVKGENPTVYTTQVTYTITTP